MTKTPVMIVHCKNAAISTSNNRMFNKSVSSVVPVPVPAGSKAYVGGRSFTETAGSKPIGCMFLSCECCVLSGRGLCVGMITCPEESNRAWCV